MPFMLNSRKYKLIYSDRRQICFGEVNVEVKEGWEEEITRSHEKICIPDG